mgnify:CR=1 FL=1
MNTPFERVQRIVAGVFGWDNVNVTEEKCALLGSPHLDIVIDGWLTLHARHSERYDVTKSIGIFATREEPEDVDVEDIGSKLSLNDAVKLAIQNLVDNRFDNIVEQIGEEEMMKEAVGMSLCILGGYALGWTSALKNR